jgi:3-oxoacyl-[acyl-carrier protein] reductase
MSSAPSSLEGRVALVTGGGGGIGRATAMELGRRGATVAVHYFRNRDGADDTVRALEGLGRAAAAFAGDLTRPDEPARVVHGVEERFGGLDILVNNAGDLIERRTLLEMTEELFRRVLDLNVTTAFLCAQAAVRGMTERGRGAIVNVASLAAHNGGGPGAFAYAAAKGAVISMTKGMAKELAPKGVRVNCVAPGLIDDTAFHQRFTPRESFDAAARTVPLGRAGTPDEVARVIAFLAGEESAYLVGETIEVNGGLFMR